jgi:hypothetical protein
MKRTLLTSLILVFMVVLGTSAATADAAERDRGMIPGTPQPSSRGEPAEPGEPAVSAPSAPCPPPPKAGPYGDLGGTPGSYERKCCGSPAPFPGLSCCDSRDCGWFKCDDQAMRMKQKRPGRLK